ncbi:Putative E3 ubiquitin-protein ligase LIN [Seminavis robusta]|uniref:E3 ubiquitin-protein ligase LIN n=1 Tax=Seminavis robusta TaxID=568900 RepID=A0A9N8HK78_9STRA|nr:Putative E3 ubiquitin-protein ligase LIN [Seminavis robusta]|eukprot:Sro920_g220270.1 Putative E3 ubiquitin-protein ligase LIN (156) ;mRNA; f:28071-28538
MASSSSTSSAATTTSAPEHFFCPISLEVMEYPVCDRRTGMTFERRAIMEWMFIHGNATCPLTRKPLSTNDLARHFELQSEISAWKKEHCPELIAANSDSDDSDSEDESESFNEEQPNSQDLKAFFNDQERVARLHNIRERVMNRRNERIGRMLGN